MHRFSALIALLLVWVAPLAAQTRADVPPMPDTRPPPMEILDDSVQPQVSIIKRDGATVEEFRVNGRLYKIRVTPENAPPYTLVDQKGDGSFVPHDAPGTPQLSVPMWVIGNF